MKKFYFFLVALVLGAMSSSAVDYYLIGGFNGWTLKDANCKFTATSSTVYTLEYQGTLSSGFKINDGTWGATYNIGASSETNTLTVGEPYTYTVSSDSKNISFTGNVTVDNPTITLDTSAKTITIVGSEGEAEMSYDIWGNFPDGSDTWAQTVLTNEEGTSLWSVDIEVEATSKFGLREYANGVYSSWISADGTATITGEGSYSCKYSGTDFTITPGSYTLTYNAETMTLNVVGAGEELVVTYYLIGDFQSSAWSTGDESCLFVQSEDNKDEYILDYVGNISTTQGLKVNDGTWDNADYVFGSNGSNLVPGEAYTYVKGWDAENIFISIGVTNPRFILNPSAQTLTIASWTAVEDIEIEENVAPVYYNLQGVKVAEPANGLYIVVRGDKVSKELVK